MKKSIKLLEAAIILFIIGVIIGSCNNRELKIVHKLSKQERLAYSKWEVYNGGNENIKYSSLKQINTTNVKKLKVAWTYISGEASPTNRTDMKTNPLIVNGVLYGLNPELKLFALNAKTGKQKWVYDPVYIPTYGKAEGRYGINFMGAGQTHISRGIAYYKPEGKENARIIYAPGGGHMLIAVDAVTGKRIYNFGKNGMIDLHEDGPTDRIIPDKDLHVSLTTPGIIYKNLIIVGSRNNESLKSSVGNIKAYDVHTGKLSWIFHTIPQPGEPGYETWTDPNAYKWVGGANAWGGLTLDEKRGIVFVTLGSVTDDFYGGFRLGNDLYGDCIVALDAKSGKLLWYFQTLHHDVWDWDLGVAGPSLATIIENGKPVDVVVCTSKQGFIYMFNRVTGKPIHPINEVPVPYISELKGEQLSPTQPIPSFFKPFTRQQFKEEDLLKDLIPDSSYQIILKKYRELKTDNMFNPPSAQGTLELPGFNGGSEWGGITYDPETGIMYINANVSPFIISKMNIDSSKLVESSYSSKRRGNVIPNNATNLQAGQVLYKMNCQPCHGPEMKGSFGNVPALIGLKFPMSTVEGIISNGYGTMYAHTDLGPSEVSAIAAYVLNNKRVLQEKFIPAKRKVEPFYFTDPTISKPGYNGKFLTPEGYPAIKPPWGTLSAIDINSGEELWKVPLGQHPAFKNRKDVQTGMENFGASVVTAGGLLFIAATSDKKFRAFNKATGELLWEVDLPYSGVATPAIYEVNGKQFVVIACGGGGKQATKSGSTYVAYALPD